MIPKEVTDELGIPTYKIIGTDRVTGQRWEASLNGGQDRWYHIDRVNDALEVLKKKQTNPHVVYKAEKE